MRCRIWAVCLERVITIAEIEAEAIVEIILEIAAGILVRMPAEITLETAADVMRVRQLTAVSR